MSGSPIDFGSALAKLPPSPFYDTYRDPRMNQDPRGRGLLRMEARAPREKVISLSTLGKLDDNLDNLQRALTDLEADLEASKATQHVASDVQAQIDWVQEIRNVLQREVRDPQAHVVWSVE